MTENEKKLLQKELRHLDEAANVLAETMREISKIGPKKEYSFLELIHLEALTSRFARLSDLLIRKIFRLIHTLDYEPQETVRDSINRAEKLGIIEDGHVFAEIRATRNSIAHEYLLEDMTLLYKNVIENTPKLLDTVKRVKEYCKRY